MFHKISLFLLFIIAIGVVSAQSIEFRCERPLEVHNNKVGRDWSFGYELADQYYPHGTPLSVSLKNAVFVSFFALEDDEVYPESGSKNLGIDPTRMEWNKEYTKDIEITV